VSPEVHRLFEAACELAPALRAGYVDSQTVDAKVKREVLSLLAHDALAEPFFADALEAAASSALLNLDVRSGTRIGAFTVVRTLGRGGMGAVYLATREGAFEQTVAIKVIQFANPATLLVERFRQERRILAGLTHPNIARLLDGGETADGLPYFVMEYVQGLEIDSYCAKHSLDLRQRLQLFQQVCSGVQYAHENLVVHRDLKPGNILVAGDGAPKLLDFGIAKVLDPLLESAATVSTRLLTPEYASPEQVRGEAITTAADVFSLGAVLYRLLTGRPPHAIQSLSPLDAARSISEREAPFATDVPAEVGAILRKALHLDPRRRYRSADDLSSDIQRYLDEKPVLAVPDSVGYRTAKFLRRNLLPVLAGAAILMALTGGAGVAIWQGRRAEHRFAEVRQLANKFLFEFEGAIHNVAGATQARELVVKTARNYLGELAADARGDRDLTAEVAEAYGKLGDVEGSRQEGNTGNTAAALADYREALRLFDSIGAGTASASSLRVGYLNVMASLATLEGETGERKSLAPLIDKAVTLANIWAKNNPSDPDLLSVAARAYAAQSAFFSSDLKFAEAAASSKRSLALKRRTFELDPTNPKAQRELGIGYWVTAAAEKAAGDSQSAFEDFSKTLDVLGPLAANNPGDVSLRREVLAASWQRASSFKDLLRKHKRDLAPVLQMLQQVYQSSGQLLRDDPANALVANDFAGISLNYGSTLQQAGRAGEALKVLLPAVDRQGKRHKAFPVDRPIAYNLSLLEMWTADSHRDLADFATALQNRREAGTLLEVLVAASPGNIAYLQNAGHNFREMGDLLARDGDAKGAEGYYAQGLNLASKLPASAAADLLAELRTSREKLSSDGGLRPPRGTGFLASPKK
jgi:tetratricopeptide (TPR) repeat protein